MGKFIDKAGLQTLQSAPSKAAKITVF